MSISAAPSPEAQPSGANHAGLMDQIYRYQRYLYDFTRKYYLFGRDSLIGDLGLLPGDRLVEIGCGTARNLIAIARAYPEARLFGLDASAAMLETARVQVRRAGLEDRISLAQGLAEELLPTSFGQDGFEQCDVFLQPFDDSGLAPGAGSGHGVSGPARARAYCRFRRLQDPARPQRGFGPGCGFSMSPRETNCWPNWSRGRHRKDCCLFCRDAMPSVTRVRNRKTGRLASDLCLRSHSKIIKPLKS